MAKKSLTPKELHILDAWVRMKWGGNHNGERKMLADILDDGETIGAMVAGKYHRTGTNHKGIAVATSKRVVFVDKGFISKETAQMGYDIIETVSDSFGMRLAGIQLTGRGAAGYSIQDVKKQEVKPFVDYVRSQLEAYRKAERTPQAAAAPRLDIAGELEKLHGLVKQGILTQDEFDAKKRSLLEI